MCDLQMGVMVVEVDMKLEAVVLVLALAACESTEFIAPIPHVLDEAARVEAEVDMEAAIVMERCVHQPETGLVERLDHEAVHESTPVG
jgi:hypothetical protein